MEISRFLGRKDRQIKTRGYRVELDEVELVLASYDCVEEAAAFPVKDPSGDTHIRALVIPKNETPCDVNDLMRHARARLPRYAVPHSIATRDAFPRTTSGKIDRSTLQSLADES